MRQTLRKISNYWRVEGLLIFPLATMHGHHHGARAIDFDRAGRPSSVQRELIHTGEARAVAKGLKLGRKPTLPRPASVAERDYLMGHAQLQPQECHPQKRKSPGQSMVGAASDATPCFSVRGMRFCCRAESARRHSVVISLRRCEFKGSFFRRRLNFCSTVLPVQVRRADKESNWRRIRNQLKPL